MYTINFKTIRSVLTPKLENHLTRLFRGGFTWAVLVGRVASHNFFLRLTKNCYTNIHVTRRPAISIRERKGKTEESKRIFRKTRARTRRCKFEYEKFVLNTTLQQCTHALSVELYTQESKIDCCTFFKR